MFFGWLVVGAAFAILAIAYGLQFSYGVFLPHMADELGLSRAALSAPYALYVLLYTSLSLIAGRMTDRLGPRVVIGVGALGLGIGYSLLGIAGAAWEIYLYLGVIAAIGASVAFVPCNATVIRWFVRRRGLALGAASAGTSAAAAFGPPLAAVLIGTLGWREAWMLMGVAGGIAMLLVAQGMVRDPESKGLHPDGDTPEPASELTATETGWTLGAAVRTRTFWLLCSSLFASWLVVFLPFVHLAAYGLDEGLSAYEAASLLSAIGFGGLAGRVVSGAATDRFGRIPGLLIALSLQALAFLGFAGSTHHVVLLVWALIYGFGYSGVSVLFPALIGDMFGRAHVGAIAGLMFAIGGAAAAAGPFTAGLIFDATGAYDVSFLIASICNSLSLLVLAFLRPPRRAAPKPGHP